jgi:hypothetical protein
MRIRFQLFTLI